MFWDECWEKGIMVFGVDELPELQTYESKDAIEEALKNVLGLETRPTNDALAAWEFSRVVKPGDVIIAKKGRKQYIGYGVVTGPYAHDASRSTYRNIRTINWVKKGEWDEDSGPIVLKTLTDITKYPEYVAKIKKLMGIEGPVADQSISMPALNTILYGPPGTGKTFTLRNKYMKLFTERQMLTREQFAREIIGELTWFQVITIVLYDLKSAKVPVIFEHPLLKAKISLQENQNPKNTIWAWLQRHTKMDCPNVKIAQRYEPLIFLKDEQAVWTVDRDMVDEQLPELIKVLKSFKEFTPKAKEIKRYEYVTFHQSYCYEDFVEGIKPVMFEDVAETLNYEVKPGIFWRMVKQALDDPNHNYALLIDEINRGNVASIFGELISLIEDDKRKGAENELTAQLPYSRQEFVVPANLYIIGAMNTADRSVEALDTALRRRFTFVAIPPQPELIEQPNNLAVDLRRLLIKINIRIEKLLDKDHCIGHSYFIDIFKSIDPFEKLRSIFAKKILPLLGEYFYNDPAKIGMVLGERFVTRKDLEEEWAAGDWGENDFEERRVYDLKDPMTLNVEDFRTVYE
jgi:DNA polymerase III delta prime subunit